MTKTPGNVRADESGALIYIDDKFVLAQLRHPSLVALYPTMDGREKKYRQELKANAEYLARAWNCHDRLVEALEDLVGVIENGDWYTNAKEYRSLIAEAKGEIDG